MVLNEAFQKAVKINPSNARAYNNLGFAYYDKGLIDESIKAYRNAININPSYARAYNNLRIATVKRDSLKKFK